MPSIHADPRLSGEGSAEQQQIHDRVEVALLEPRANGFILPLAPLKPLGLIRNAQLGWQDCLDARVWSEFPVRTEQTGDRHET